MNNDPRNPLMQADSDSTHWLERAVAAERGGDADAAFDLLQRSVATARPSPLAHHLLAAEFMERGDVGNAALHFTRALARAPEMHVARLQLALLWLGQDSPEAAAATLTPLLSSQPNTAFGLFAAGLDKLSRNEAVAAIANLEDGVSLGCENAPLLDDMRILVDRLRRALAAPPPDEDIATLRHGLAIGAYASSTDSGS